MYFFLLTAVGDGDVGHVAAFKKPMNVSLIPIHRRLIKTYLARLLSKVAAAWLVASYFFLSPSMVAVVREAIW
jgi:hypothetical protein